MTTRALVLLILVAGCTSESAAPEPLEPAYRFDALECETIEGTAIAAPTLSDEGIDQVHYWVARDDGSIGLDTEGAGGEPLGRATITYSVERGRYLQATSTYEYSEGERTARQSTHVILLDDVFRHTTRFELGETSYSLWWTSSDQGELISATLAVPVDESSDVDDAIVRELDATYRTLTLYEDGEPVADQGDVDQLFENHGLDIFTTDPLYRRLVTTVDDEGWRTHATTRIQSCNGQIATETEDERGLIGSVSSPLNCDDMVDALSTGLNTYDRINIARDAARITLALAAAGAITTGALGAVAFVGGVVAIYAAGKAIDRAVIANGGDIVSAPLALAGDEEAAEAVRSFYSPKGGSTGDPHITTHDGSSYDFQASGEFVLARSTTHNFEVQARQVTSPTSRCPHVSFNAAVAVQLGDYRVTYEPQLESALRVDASPIDLHENALVLPDGSEIFRDGSMLQLLAPTGESVLLWGHTYLSIYIALPNEGRGAYEGLLGDFDEDPDNDLVDASGVIEGPASFEQIHGALAEHWEVSTSSSLFDYEEGADPTTYRIDDSPAEQTRLLNLDPALRQNAELACENVANPIAFEDCVLDVACTGEDEYADLHEGRDPLRRADPFVDISFGDWTQEGPLGNGVWTVDDDGRSVIQERNGSPTFFVSPLDYIDAEIEGTLHSMGGDDDFIGFVFGYQSPLMSAASDENEIDTFIVTWKGGTQTGAEEGLRLMHVHGNLEAAGETPLLWDATASEGVEVLDTDLGTDRGWERVSYRFTLRYTSERIEVYIDDELRLELDAAASAYAFVPGRFGFYNYSQADTHYADFQASLL